MRSAQRRALFLASVSLSLATLAQAQLLTIDMVPVPAEDSQPGGPEYSYGVGRFEVTNAQYVEFLNDAEFHNEQQNPGFGDERGANLAFRQPPFGGDVGLVIGAGGEADAVFDISRSLLLYDDDAPVGHRFGVTPGKANDPVVGLSWIGAVKFCNWLGPARARDPAHWASAASLLLSYCFQFHSLLSSSGRLSFETRATVDETGI